MPYGISRQWYYYTGELMVEIQEGGIDYAGPDMLTPKYGWAETREFDKPQTAALEAIKIMKLWQADEPDEEILITARGKMSGMWGCEGDPMTIGQIARWAREEWAGLDKCDHCGEVLPEHPYGNNFTISLGEYPYCSDNCADNAYWKWRETCDDWEENGL